MSNNANTGRVFNLTAGSGDMAASIYDPNGLRTDVFAYARNQLQIAFDTFYDNLWMDRAIYRTICDSAGNAILDSGGDAIAGRIVIEIK